MRTAAKPQTDLRDDLERAMNTFRIMADAMLAEADDLSTRFAEEGGDRIALWHAREALRKTLGKANLSRAEDAMVRRAYKLVCRQIGVAP
jgi:hypothetical protein